jgi:hypothetical protein
VACAEYQGFEGANARGCFRGCDLKNVDGFRRFRVLALARIALGAICPGAQITSQFAVVYQPDLACSVGVWGGSHGRSRGQPARPFYDRLCGGFSDPLCRPAAWAGWPMKWSSAWLISSAWVQMIACGPPAMTVERALFSNAGSLRLVAS